MKLLDRYILGEIAGPFVLGLFIFTVVLFFNQMAMLAELVINKGVSLGVIGRMIVYILPSFFSLTIPMAVLLAVVVAFGRMGAANEIVAFANQGISLWRLGLPALAFGAVTTALTLAVMLGALPWGNYAFKKLLFEVAQKKASIGLEEGVFNTNFASMVAYVEKVDHRSDRMEGVLLQQVGPQGEEITLFAKSGRMLTDEKKLEISMLLEDVLIQIRSGAAQTLTITRAPRYVQRLDLAQQAAGSPTAPKSEREMTVGELAVEAARRRAKGLDHRSLEVEIHKKYALPFACLVFVVIGVPLGLVARRSDKLVGFGVAIAVIFVYYLFITSGETLGDKGKLPPAVGMWWGNAVLAVVGLVLYRRKAADKPITVFEKLGDLLFRLRERLAGRGR